MSKQRQLGDILRDSGRITRDEVDRALAHQRTHGGYFGEAAVALGLLSREEIDWALASQLDLPFIFPDADAVDRDAAMLVPADWALAHLAVPMVRTGNTLTVAVAEPLSSDVLTDLSNRTGLEVEMALASGARIRELIRALYGEGDLAGGEAGPPVQLAELVAGALAQGAERIGISERGAGALGWYVSGGSVHRQPLEPGWDGALAEILEPAPFDGVREGDGWLTRYEATLSHRGAYLGVEVQVMSSLGGTEILIRPGNVALNRTAGVVLPPPVAADLQMLARGGQARIGLAGDADLGDLLPQLPALAFGPRVRAVHVAREAVPGVYSLTAEEPGRELVDRIEAFRFDAITVDLPPDDERLGELLSAAPIAFTRDPGTDNGDAGRLDLNWRLTATRDDEAVVWDLSPINW